MVQVFTLLLMSFNYKLKYSNFFEFINFEHCDITNLDNDTLESLIFNKASFEAYIKQLLLVNHYRVEIFVNKGGKWTLDFKV